MRAAAILEQARGRVLSAAYRLRHPRHPVWDCPLCGYRGPFKPVRIAAGPRPFAECPGCHARERHRLQILVLRELFAQRRTGELRMLHVAPEPFLMPVFRALVGRYETADLVRRDVDHRVDLCKLPFDDGMYDLVYASHVLEHIRDDRLAIDEIRRVLRPGGLAILPVPIVAAATIEYEEPNPLEENHVRAPGADYFDRYRAAFAHVALRGSGAYPARYQCHIHAAPGAAPAQPQEDVVPICFRDAIGDPQAWPPWTYERAANA